MRIGVFLGPTLGVDAARRVWDVPVYLPPVRQGDVHAVARHRPVAIGIVDGYFRGVPAVWHKEILWAMTRGIHVFGASSMGALRAAELAAFGMRGVGEVYASLARGDWDDDDEVAVLHAPAELGYRPLTEAMVNIRATLARALEAGIVDAALAERLVARAKARPFAERDYARMARDVAAGDGGDASALARFERWLPEGRVDVKADDAVRLLRTLRDEAETFAVPLRVDYGFAPTDAWRQALARAPDTPSPFVVESDTRADAALAAALALEAIKLDGTWRSRVRAAALGPLLSFGRGSAEEAPDSALLADTRDMLRRTHGLWRADTLADWKRANGLDDEAFEALVANEARVRHALASAGALDACVVRDLQASGDYARYLGEAKDMCRRLLAADGSRAGRLPGQTAVDTVDGPALHVLLAAHGTDVAGDEPEAVTAHAHRLGFADAHALHRALLHRHHGAAIEP